MVDIIKEFMPESKAEAEAAGELGELQLAGGLVSEVALGFPAAALNFVPITPSSITELRSLNSTLFPMSYHERYYKEVLAVDSLSRIVYWGTKVAATFSCRLQVFHVEQTPKIECYIMTFGVLAAFRRLRIGTVMLKSITEYYQRRREVSRIALHVHTTNEIALNFYLKHGFVLVDTIPEYYKKLSPSSAHLLYYIFPR